ncbi:MAG: patatin-like phospholipase family protein [Chitinophagales bacterium]|nr:patatin-like phospholipase family protein [Chitinophagaceae bacterium]MCB9063968.1 patatin-like phospholipase family protein [Chitinophagales bacterium]
MQGILHNIFRFLPVQLLLLHFRKYQLFLVFWIILFLTVNDNFASVFGASSLFLAPEYLGKTSFMSMLLLGGAFGVFIMAWHITTFIINNTRIPYIGAVRFAFIKYCINNSIIPLFFLIFYTVHSIRYQLIEEGASVGDVIWYQLGLYCGFVLIILISFAYFFRVGRDLLKVVLGRITSAEKLKDFIPFDSLDYDIDLIKADTYLTGKLQIKKFSEEEAYHPRLLKIVLRRHGRNATTATIFAILILLLLGLFSEQPKMRVPAGASFVLLFSVIMGMVGAVKHFFHSWEVLGWILIIGSVAFLVKNGVLDLRSRAYGLNYSKDAKVQPYNYQSLKSVFTKERYYEDKEKEEERLNNWKAQYKGEGKPPLIVVTSSGGGSRATYWTFRALQYADSVTDGMVYPSTVMMTGASGGMIGVAYWRSVHNEYVEGLIEDPYKQEYQENTGKDLLNSIIFSLASNDLISPFNKISLGGYSYTKDRGYAMEQELIRATDGMLDRKIGDFRRNEMVGKTPLLIVNGTIINDGRRLMMAAQPISYLTQSEYDVKNAENPAIDGVDMATFFKDRNPYNLRLPTALRMTSTFPYILPVVRLPSDPQMNIMDAGLRDNFGMELINRYLHVHREWIKENTSKVIVLQIRDTREYDVYPGSEMNTLTDMVADPLFAIQNKWEPFQSYSQGYSKDYLKEYMGDRLEYITLQYIPQSGRSAALNFHLTSKEKQDLLNSIYNKKNTSQIERLKSVLKEVNP